MVHLALGNLDPSYFHRKWRGSWIEGVRNQVEPLMLVPYPGKACGQYSVRICQVYSVSIFMNSWVSV